MNPYEQLMAHAINSGLADMPAVKKDFKTDVDVAQNVGHAKLKKGPYTPFGPLKAPPSGGAMETYKDTVQKPMETFTDAMTQEPGK